MLKYISRQFLNADRISSIKDDPITEEIIPDLTRRNTIVAPPSLEEVEPDMINVEEGNAKDDSINDVFTMWMSFRVLRRR